MAHLLRALVLTLALAPMSANASYTNGLASVDGSSVTVIENQIRSISKSHMYEITEGNIPNHVSVSKFGRNSNIGLTEEDIWSSGGAYVYLTAAETLKLASDNINDASAGAGAQTVQIYGLDGGYATANETIILNGTTPVASTNTYIRVYRIKVLTAGAGGKNAGILTLSNNAVTNTLATVEVGLNQTLMSQFVIPAGMTAFITSFWATSINGKDCTFFMYVKPFGSVFQVKKTLGGKDMSFRLPFDSTLKVTQKSDIVLRAFCEVAGGIVSGGFDGWYESN